MYSDNAHFVLPSKSVEKKNGVDVYSVLPYVLGG